MAGGLDDIVRHPDNQFCADCGTAAPRWSSINLGVVVCIDCSGVHRGMGAHISKIRSLTLDKWEDEAIQLVLAVGNVRANRYYEARLPPTFSRDALRMNRRALEDFIEGKYRRLDFAPPKALSPAAEHTQKRRSVTTADSNPRSEKRPSKVLPRDGDLLEFSGSCVFSVQKNSTEPAKSSKTKIRPDTKAKSPIPKPSANLCNLLDDWGSAEHEPVQQLPINIAQTTPAVTTLPHTNSAIQTNSPVPKEGPSMQNGTSSRSVAPASSLDAAIFRNLQFLQPSKANL